MINANYEPEAPPIIGQQFSPQISPEQSERIVDRFDGHLVRHSTYARHRRRRGRPASPFVTGCYRVGCKIVLTVLGGCVGLLAGAVIAGLILGKPPEKITREVLKSVGLERLSPPSHTIPTNLPGR